MMLHCFPTLLILIQVFCAPNAGSATQYSGASQAISNIYICRMCHTCLVHRDYNQASSFGGYLFGRVATTNLYVGKALTP